MKQEKSKLIKFQFVSSEFKWLWLVAGKRYLQYYGLGEVDVLDDDSGLTVWGWDGGTVQKGWGKNGMKKKKGWESKNCKKVGDTLGKGVGASKLGECCDPHMNYGNRFGSLLRNLL